jgi:hypothetical protein
MWHTRVTGLVYGGTMKKLAFGFITLLGLAWVALVGWDRRINAHRIMAGPENQSQFFRSYNPTAVTAKFQYDEGFHSSEGNSADQGIRSIRHHAEFVPRFIMWTDRKRELLNALREDILLRLRTTGTSVVAIRDEGDGGFTYKYAADNSIGSISVHAPVHDPEVQRQFQLKTGLDDISVDIALEETWTRPASETKWWMAATD